MDFFARQEQSRRNTRVLVALFALAVAATVTAVTLASAMLISMYQHQYYSGSIDVWASTDWITRNGSELLVIAALTAGFIGATSLYRIATLASGGGQVARLLGATEVSPATTDLLERRLVNVVEEIAIASGTPVPEIFVLEQEQGINAFAAGSTPADAAVAVTRGALDRLTRAELQGVVAHEFSHILNGDMRLNQQLMGLSFGILALSLIGRWLLHSVRFTRRNRFGRGAIGIVAAGAILAAIGSIGLIFSRLIKAGVSRQREMLADASAVQFTRDRMGLAGALKKIGGYTGNLLARNSEEVAHMLFTRGARAFHGWFATHPPLDERILALDPSFTPGDYPNVSEVLPAGEAEDKTYMRLTPLAASASLTDNEIVSHTGNVATHDLAAAMRVAIPEPIDHAAHSRELSLLLVLALGLSRSVESRRPQQELLDQQLGAQRGAKCRDLAAELDALDDQYRLPILDLCMPALKQRPTEQLGFLMDLLHRLSDIDQDEELFDYVLLKVLESYLRAGGKTRQALTRQQHGKSARSAVADLLACVAAWGHDDPQSALEAFHAGLERVSMKPRGLAEPSFSPLEAARTLETLDAALARLDLLRPKDKQRVLAGVLACIRHDRHIATEELELFRAIAATLGCPMPPARAIGVSV